MPVEKIGVNITVNSQSKDVSCNNSYDMFDKYGNRKVTPAV
ncbi:unnamed protein product [Oppiella nova]|uniref:Uncharacterized protein n=1 Tax=Oppiella nova TaxID=334625 RepID=A0A7R9LPJ3_9ACAR|nr:unnamed protein product [Oppiella nova]CAG2165324.1 unnamed protein product [Oppiella nova]